MLNYQSASKFFDYCLEECDLRVEGTLALSLELVRANASAQASLVKTLRDLQLGADVVYKQGKPNERGSFLKLQDWERAWGSWAASRKAAFFSRAALLMLGQTEFYPYFLDTLRTSHNIVFVGAASDALQHASGHYLNGPEEDFAKNKLADWWEPQLGQA